ncbi:MAG: hypothetical protein U1F71_15215 [Verrucomicrobiaceae bacterium]
MIKFTYPGEFGRSPFYGSGGLGNTHALPFEYLQRLQLQNDLFGDDILVEAVLDHLDGLLVVTSQPFITGDHPTLDQIAVYMIAEGFAATRSDDWYRAADDVAIFDSHPGNYIRTPEDIIVPIDLFPLRHPSREHLRMMGVTSAT